MRQHRTPTIRRRPWSLARSRRQQRNRPTACPPMAALPGRRRLQPPWAMERTRSRVRALRAERSKRRGSSQLMDRR